MDIEPEKINNDTMNDDWIVKFENIDNLYKDFYKDNLYYTNIYSIYINKNNEIDKLTNEPFLLTKPNYITREEIIRILKNKTHDSGNNKYSLLSILKYNISLDVEDVVPFLKCNSQDLEHYNNKFLTSIKNVDTIYFENTISMFHDLNDVFFLFYEKQITNKNNSHNVTKKIYLRPNSSHKKTIKR